MKTLIKTSKQIKTRKFIKILKGILAKITISNTKNNNKKLFNSKK